MISKKISCKPENNNYRRLGNYIVDASHDGEKLLLAWQAGCMMEDYQEALTEIVDTQALNTRTKKTKTYHLIVSFQPEDESCLTPDKFMEIEKGFAQTLGLEEHQRLCGVHKNTHNVHMHIAYNLVHPEKLTFHEPFRDFPKRDALCRELEQKYNLKIDKGIPLNRDPAKLTEPAARVEIQTGLQSFEGYAKGHREAILAKITVPESWEQVHETLALYGMRIKLKGNGLVITDDKGKAGIKASTFERSFSKKKLETLLGSFAEAKGKMPFPLEQHTTTPVHKKNPARDALFAEYVQRMEEKKKQYDVVRSEQEKDLMALSQSTAAKKKSVALSGFRRSMRSIHLQDIYQKNRRNRLAINQKCSARKKDLRERYPYSSWAKFLQHKALEGNEKALAVLRSRKEPFEPEKKVTRKSDYEMRQAVRDRYAAKVREVEDSSKLTAKSKRALISVFRMQRLADEEDISLTRHNTPAKEENAPIISGFKYTIDTKGTVIFTLPGGGIIRDDGREILFSGRNAEAKQVASQYAKLKWGERTMLNDNAITRPMHQKKLEISR